jgi:hypothetical protein
MLLLKNLPHYLEVYHRPGEIQRHFPKAETEPIGGPNPTGTEALHGNEIHLQ